MPPTCDIFCSTTSPTAGALLATLGLLWAAFGRSWPLLGRYRAALGLSWAPPGRSCAAHGCSWAALGATRKNPLNFDAKNDRFGHPKAPQDEP